MSEEEIIYGFKDIAELYDASVELHGEENMKSRETRVYNLKSIERIEFVMKNGEFIVLKVHNKISGIISYKKGTTFVDFQGNTQSLDDWEIGSLLVHEEHRGKGYAKLLFSAVINRLKEKGAKHAYAILTGTFDKTRKGEAREMTKPAEKICRNIGGQAIGFATFSWGPVYKIPIE